MKKAYKILIAFVIGATIYPILEILWRGYTHWTMSITAGICVLLIYVLSTKAQHLSLWKKCLIGSGIITFIEFIVGCLVNLGLGWAIWDYSGSPVNILGQVCLIHSAIWALLCLPIVYLSNFLNSEFSLQSLERRNLIKKDFASAKSRAARASPREDVFDF